MLFAAFLFIYDSSHLLKPNEAVLIRKINSWTYFCSIGNFSFRGMDLYISNPLIIHRAEYILAWDFENIDITQKFDLPHRNLAHNALTILAYVSWVLLFILLPFLLFFFRTEAALLLCTGLIYLASIFTSIIVYRCRTELNLSKKQSIDMALEFVFCPPFTANVIRKISRLQQLNINFIAAAIRTIPAEKWEELRYVLDKKIQFEIEESSFDESKKLQLIKAKHFLCMEKN